MDTYLTENTIRNIQSFDFDWYFYHGDSRMNPGERSVEGYEKVQLPHDWSLFYPFNENAVSRGAGGYVETGIGWYRKLFRAEKKAEKGERVFIRFDGVYMLAKVWLNGEELGSHVYGYTPFEWEITDLLLQGEVNVLDVRVDNSAQPNSRWYSGSGITRNVWIYRVSRDYILPYGVWLRASQISEDRAELKVETRLFVSEKSIKDKEKLWVETEIFSPEGKTCGKQRTEIKTEKEALVEQNFCIKNPMLWDLETPFLYEAVSRVYRDETLIDEVHTNTGIRSIAFHADTGFWINGRHCKINGVCVHHDGGCVGAAVPPRIWERRLEKLKKMGANAIRMSHNPPDPALLELCDKMGFLVMDEAFDEWKALKNKEAGSNTHASRGYSDWFEEHHEEDLKGMLLRDRNHPSIIIWSIGNEVPDQVDENGYLTTRHLMTICRELDPDRLITQANDQICAEPRAAKESFLNELDIVGYNYAGRWRQRAETFYDEDKRTNPKWRIIGTENSGVGGIRGEYPLGMKENAGWWKHPYYSAPVEAGKLLRYTMSHDYVAGDFMWTGVDYLGEAHWPERSASAGVLDTCGFEKDSFYFYQSIWKREEPMVYLFPHWNLELEHGTILPVLCYTTCDCAELFLNGKSYGKKSYAYPAYGMTEKYGHFDKTPLPLNTGDLFLSWDVPYETGQIEVAGYVDGEEKARCIIKTAGAAAALRVNCYGDGLCADGRDICQIEVSIVDQDGIFCPQADNRIAFQMEGPARLIGVDNGNPQCLESMKGSSIPAFHGRAFAVFQSDGNPGKCRVKVMADGIKEVVAEFEFA